MTELVALGLNHKSAPVELRERLAVGADDLGRVLEELRRHTWLHEVMLVSTCNRVEIYGVAAREIPPAAPLVELARLQSIDPGALEGHVFARTQADAARHIFRVASSLESMVVGEPQILGQVKTAYSKAKEGGAIGPVLDRCVSLAIKCAKRVRSETEIARGSASVPSVAVDLATRIFGELVGCTVLIVGAGDMAEQAAVHLQAAGASELVVVNRSTDRGEALAQKIGGRYEAWDRLEAQLVRADVVVTSTGAKMPVIDRSMMKPVMKMRRHRPLFLVDIAVPRDVDPAVSQTDHVYLYNVDDLQGIVHDNMRLRAGEAERADAVVDEEVQEFLAWMSSRSLGPLIAKLQHHGNAVVDAEIKRALKRLPGLSEEQRAVVDKLGRVIMQKLLHRPISNLRRANGEGVGQFDGPALAEALSTLFELDSGEPTPPTAARGDVRPQSAAIPEPTPVPRPEPS